MTEYVRTNPDEDLTGTPEARAFYALIGLLDDLKRTVGALSPYCCFKGDEPDEAFRGFCEECEDYLLAATRIYANYARMISATVTDITKKDKAERVLKQMDSFVEKLQEYPDLREEFEWRFKKLFYTQEEWETPTLFGEQKGFNPYVRIEHELFRQVFANSYWVYDEYQKRFWPSHWPEEEEEEYEHDESDSAE